MRLIDSCITQLKARGPRRTCDESKEGEEEEEEEEEDPQPQKVSGIQSWSESGLSYRFNDCLVVVLTVLLFS